MVQQWWIFRSVNSGLRLLAVISAYEFYNSALDKGKFIIYMSPLTAIEDTFECSRINYTS